MRAIHMIAAETYSLARSGAVAGHGRRLQPRQRDLLAQYLGRRRGNGDGAGTDVAA